MKTLEVTKITASGVEVTVTVIFGMVSSAINADGDIVNCGDKFKKSVTTRLSKNGETLEFDRFEGMTGVIEWSKIPASSKTPKGAYARIGSSYVSEQTWNARAEALAEIEAQIVEPAEKPAVKMIKNPAYAHMTDEQIKTAEINYDNLQNEGCNDDGNFNPFRDRL